MKEKHYNPDIHHRRSIRLKEYDYSQNGLYFVTVCVHEKMCLFGEIKDEKMILNEMGRVVEKELLKTSDIRNDMNIHNYIVMPNHVHFIVEIRRGELHSPEMDDPCEQNEINDSCNQGECNSPLRCSQTIGAMVRGFKGAVSKWTRSNTDIYNVWQRNYHEHIIRDQKSYDNINHYILTNPLKWKDDIYY